MKTIINKIYILPLLLILLNACKKDGEMISKPIKAYKPITMEGFALKPLEQYFDGLKVRELQGLTRLNGIVEQQVAFYNDEMLMELKSQGGETLYQQKLSINDASSNVPKFYYDGLKLYNSFPSPQAEAGKEKVAFYFDIPVDMPVDIAYGDGSDVNAVHYLARNVQPKQWTEFIPLAPLGDDALYVLLLKAGKKEYLINNDVNYSYMEVQLPTASGYQGGGVQGWYVGYHKESEGVYSLMPQINLVQMFPH